MGVSSFISVVTPEKYVQTAKMNARDFSVRLPKMIRSRSSFWSLHNKLMSLRPMKMTARKWIGNDLKGIALQLMSVMSLVVQRCTQSISQIEYVCYGTIHASHSKNGNSNENVMTIRKRIKTIMSILNSHHDHQVMLHKKCSTKQ